MPMHTLRRPTLALPSAGTMTVLTLGRSAPSRLTPTDFSLINAKQTRVRNDHDFLFRTRLADEKTLRD